MPDGELISVTINAGIKKFSELGRHDNSNDNKSKYKKVCVGDIAYNSMRMWQGASGYSPYEGIVSPAYTVLAPNPGINSKCLSYQFKLPKMIHTFQINSQGITSDNWNLKYPALSEIETLVSKDEEEQAKIAVYFDTIDNLITLHQRKLELRFFPGCMFFIWVRMLTWCPSTEEQGFAGSEAPRPAGRSPICSQRRGARRRKNKALRGAKHHAQPAEIRFCSKDVVPVDGRTRFCGE